MITSKTIKLGVIGNPVAHSLSPEIHNLWYKEEGIDAVYLGYKVEEDSLKEAINFFKHSEFRGINITMPFKEKVLEYIDEVDDLARQVGSVNTIKFLDRQVYGYNTDIYGFINTLKYKITPSTKVIVLGAGGAARSILYGLKILQVKNIIIFNRNIEKAKKLVSDLKLNAEIKGLTSLNSFDQQADIIINCTSIEATGGSLSIDFSMISQATYFYDVYYKKDGTDFINQAKAKGFNGQDGFAMLKEQARLAHEIWFDTNSELK